MLQSTHADRNLLVMATWFERLRVPLHFASATRPAQQGMCHFIKKLRSGIDQVIFIVGQFGKTTQGTTNQVRQQRGAGRLPAHDGRRLWLSIDADARHRDAHGERDERRDDDASSADRLLLEKQGNGARNLAYSS